MGDETKRGRGRPRQLLPEGVKKPKAFARWLADSGMHPSTVASILGVSVGSIYGWRRGEYGPTRKMTVRIEQLSGGAVPCNSWD